jgi:hypothetical protein
LASWIGSLQRIIDSSLSELTELEVIINASRRNQVGRGELERTRMVLTDSIVKMDAELRKLQRRMIQAGRPSASSNETPCTLEA